MKEKFMTKEGPNDWILHQARPIRWIANGIFNNKSSKFKLSNYFKHDNVESKQLDDAKINKIDASTSMNYQSKPTPFFNLHHENQVVKIFERKPRIKTMPAKNQNISKVQPLSPPSTNVFSMNHQDKPIPLFKSLPYIKNLLQKQQNNK